MNVKTIGIIGYGHFGQFVHTLCKRFLPAAEVRVYSRSGAGDAAAVSLETAAASDLVFLCVPISAYEITLQELKPHLSETSIMIDVATVKKHTTELFAKELSDQPHVCCHPMFGAESYKKTNGDVSGYRIVVTNHTLEEATYAGLRNWLTELGFLVIDMSANEHDRLLADTLFMNHYISQTMKAADFKRTAVDTVSFQSLMNAVESVAQDGKLFKDVYDYNPYCKEAAVRFHEAQKQVLDGLLGQKG